ncbi:HisA/HisF-related TIM barrel protein [Microbacterium sp. 179-I 3D3 NHS]|uniref:HisA/HisF-related TIM barrel protein n=1 Tax=unclassified Microbacterium TaxID=2609290 RepID=UPI00399FF8D4
MRPRIIPVLQLHRGWLTKTRGFRGNPYLGDPVNAVRIFNELEVDELVICDISASRGETPLDPGLIESIASEAFMPVAYGGGISTLREASLLVRSGIEKVILNTAVARAPELVREIASEIGTQSVVASVDVSRASGTPRSYVGNGLIDSGLSPVEFAQEACRLGVGELIVSSIDRDGTSTGYDLEVVAEVAAAVDVPVIAQGGAASLDDFRSAIDSGAAAASAGSRFVYFGRHDAVLITYPDAAALDRLWSGTV